MRPRREGSGRNGATSLRRRHEGTHRLGSVAALVAVVVALSLGAAGCGATSVSAYTVNGKETSQTSFDDDLRVLASNATFTNTALNGANVVPSTVRLDARISVSWLNTLIESDVVRQELARKKVSVSAAERSELRQRLATFPGFGALPDWFRTDLVDRQAGYIALARDRGLDLTNDNDNAALGTIVARLRARPT